MFLQRIDWDKPIEQMDGKAARFIANRKHRRSDLRFVVMIEDEKGEEYLNCVDEFGCVPYIGQMIRNKQEKVYVGLYLYENDMKIFNQTSGLSSLSAQNIKVRTTYAWNNKEKLIEHLENDLRVKTYQIVEVELEDKFNGKA